MNERGFNRVAGELRKQIITGHLAQGNRLPSEAELSAQHSVSRSTIREALRVLESQNLIVTTRGASGGSWINHPNRDQIAGYLETGFKLMTLALDMPSVQALLEVRAIVEVPAAQLAAQRRTEEHIDQLAESIRSHKPSAEKHAVHRSFHNIIFEAANNALLHTVSQPIFAVVDERFARDKAPPEMWDEVARFHEEIFEAVRDQDSKAAGELMREHLAQLTTAYLAMTSTSIREEASMHSSSN